MRAPVSMCMIVKDDRHAPLSIRSIREHVEEVVVVFDTKADPDVVRDVTQAAAGGDFVTGHHVWCDDFSAARNESVRLARQPFISWIDSDDVVEGAEHLAREIDRMSLDERLLAPYDYGKDAFGATLQQWRERVVRNDGTWHWTHPTHEGLVKRDGHRHDPGLDVWAEGVRWVHTRTETGARSRSLAILERWAETHDDPWTNLNLGLELHQASRYEEAIGRIERYLPQSEWREEKAMALLRASDCAVGLDVAGQADGFARAFKFVTRAAGQTPGSFEVEYALAKLHWLSATMLGDSYGAHETIQACQRAVGSPETRTPLGRSPQDRTFRVWDLMRVAAEVEEDWGTAIEANAEILKVRPESPPHIFAAKRYRAARIVQGDVKWGKIEVIPNPAMPKDSMLLRSAGGGELLIRGIGTKEETNGKATGHESGHGGGAGHPGGAAQPPPGATGRTILAEAGVGVPPARPQVRAQGREDDVQGGHVEPDRRDVQAKGVRVIELEEGESFTTPKTPGESFMVRVKPRVPKPGSVILELLSRPMSVAFLCGPAPRPWNPDIVAEGFGGSETAVVEVAKRLARLNCEVTVYGSPGEDGTWDGVDYVNWTPDLKPRADVAVVWRLAALLPSVDAPVRLMWCHDTEAIGMTYEFSLLADRFLALSDWHALNLIEKHQIPESQVFVTRNGVDPARFARPEQKTVGGTVEMRRKVDPGGLHRDPATAIYASSPDRGLGLLLDLWPEIHRRYLEAGGEGIPKLDVYYSFDSWAAQANASKSEPQRFLVQTIQRRMRELGERGYGVTYHGWTSKKELARAMMQGGALLYPTWFFETSCMVAMEALAAGMRVVCPPVAALAETVGEWGSLVSVRGSSDWLDPEWQEEFVEEAVDALRDDPDEWGKTREEIAEQALRTLSWDGVATDWLALFRELLDDAVRGRMPAYEPAREVAQ